MANLQRGGWLFLLLLSINTLAQKQSVIAAKVKAAREQGAPFVPALLFTRVGDPTQAMKRSLSKGGVLRIDREKLRSLRQQAPQSLLLDLPYASGKTITVELVRHEILAPGFKVTSAVPDAQTSALQRGIYYQGTVVGSGSSVAALSLVGDELMGVVDIAGEGNYVVGPIEKDEQRRYAFFKSDDLAQDFKPDCETIEVPERPGPLPQAPAAGGGAGNCVKIYFECDYDLYVEKGSTVQGAVDYVTGIYNMVKTLYDNESINTAISEIFVWNTPDGYPTTSTADALYAFQAARSNNFNGDVAHLLSRGAPSGGGVAFRDVLCRKDYAFAYSYIYSSYNQLPSYSWTVEVITHEMGHTLGSPHTHQCSWDVNGDGQWTESIDGCGPTAGYSGGTCAIAPVPDAGTIMSYCHLIGGVGIDFNLGFGPLPGALIRDRVYNASCLQACSTCPVSVSLTKVDATCNGAANGSATANPSGGSAPYTYQWSNGATTSSISNVPAGNYSVTVRDQGGAGCAAYAEIAIGQPQAISASGVVTPESQAGASNGAIDVSVSGGTAPYSYSWSTGATNQDLTGLAAGIYTVVITDANNCTGTRSFEVTSNGCAAIISAFPAAEGFENGLGIWKQSASDNFDWARNIGSTPTNKTGPSGAYQGSYYLYTESNGNSGTATLESPCFDLAGKANPKLEFAYHMLGNSMGTMNVQISTNNGGSWSTVWSRSGNQGSAWQIASVALDAYINSTIRIRINGTLGSGQFSDMAIDAINISTTSAPCTAPVLVTSSTPVTCANGADGSVSVAASGAISPYSYRWSNGATAASVTGLQSGTYTVLVADATGCEASGLAVVSEPAAIALNFQVTPVSKMGASDGAIALNVTNGASPYAYLWNNAANTKDIINIPAGTYAVTVTDARNCKQSGSAIVSEVSSCNPATSLPYNESFETSIGLWTQETLIDDFDWRRNSGSTPSGNTGPTSAYHGNFYLYTEANDANGGSKAIITSPCFTLTNMSDPTFGFAYMMNGSQIGSLYLDLSPDNGETWETIWLTQGNKGSSWYVESISLKAYIGKVVKVRFRGTLGNGPRGDMAIDGIRVSDGANIDAAITKTTTGEGIEWRATYPNPASSQVNLKIYSPDYRTVRLQLSDAVGRGADLGPVSLVAGENTIPLKLPARNSGLYLLTLRDGYNVISRPIQIMR